MNQGTRRDLLQNIRSALQSSLKPAISSAPFGIAALAVVLARLTIPIPGTGVVSDPREIFTTTGASLTGPVGGLIIGILAGFREPDIPVASLIAHLSGGLWMGLAYKKVVFQKTDMPVSLLGWVLLVLGYYYLFAIPGFVIGQAAFHQDIYTESYGEGTSLLRAYITLGEGALPEALLTTAVTSLVYLALPRRHRRPLW